MYGHFPAKEAEVTSWDTICINPIGPYHFKQPNKKTKMLWALIMIYLSTGWFYMTSTDTKRFDVIIKKFEKNLANAYLWPTHIILDCVTEYMEEVTKMMKQDYGITHKPITLQIHRLIPYLNVYIRQ